MNLKTKFSMFGYTVAVFALVAVGCISVYTRDIEIKNIVLLALPLVTALFGALFANRLNAQREMDREKIDRKRALQWACFVLFRQRNALKESLTTMEKYRNDPTRWLSMPAFAMPDYSDLTHVFSDLAFLLETEHVQALMDLSINQENFDQAIKTVELRSKFLVEEVQPRASTLQMAGKTFNESELVNHFGEHLFYGAVNYATAVFEHLDSAVNFNFDTHRKIHRAAKDMFPESKFASHNKEEAVNGP